VSRTYFFRHRFRVRQALVLTALGLFAAAAAIGTVKPTDEALPTTQLVHEVLPLSSAARPDVADEAQPDTLPFVRETRIRAGDTLAAILTRLTISTPGLQAFLTQNEAARSIYRLYPGRTVQAAHRADGSLAWLRYLHTPSANQDGQIVTKLLHVEPADAGFRAEERTHGTERQVRAAVGTIRSSLFGATDAVGIPDSITLQMAEILSSKIDFLRDLRQGDTFRVVYETRSYEGRYVGAGRLLAVEFDNRGKRHSAVWFNPEDGIAKGGAYYDMDGNSLQGAFLRNAIKFTRISSTFGGRVHPIHKRWINHNGVDYAAPTGTPIHATGEGTITFAGKQNGYGNVVFIQHRSGYSTVYAHQSKIAPGIKKGVAVAQGQLIGYVGSTGWATGPHLHYEFRIGGKPVDPLKVKLPESRPLDPRQVQAFAAVAAPFKEQMQMLTQLQLAQAARSDAAQTTALASR